jgi:FemAB-related protein (PEP-CTERM system-associated)
MPLGNKLKISVCSTEDAGQWDSYIAGRSESTVSHLACWSRIVNRAYGHTTFFLVARRDNSVVGVLPLVWVKSYLFGNALSSMPYQDYGGILADDAEAAEGLLDYALKLKTSCKSSCLELRYRQPPIPLDDVRGIVRTDKVTLALDISESSETLWKNFSGKVRNQIRKAQKSGLYTEVGGGELLEEFYPVWAANMRDLGSPVHHRSFFSGVFGEFGDNARLLVIRENGHAVGGLVCLFFRDSVVVPWASSLRTHFSKCPNNLLYWDAIQYACSRECKFFDFGRSTVDSGTYNFKLQWGAKPEQLNWQYFQDNSKAAGIPGKDKKFQIAAEMWKRLPLPLTTSLGPHFRKYITN